MSRAPDSQFAPANSQGQVTSNSRLQLVSVVVRVQRAVDVDSKVDVLEHRACHDRIERIPLERGQVVVAKDKERDHELLELRRSQLLQQPRRPLDAPGKDEPVDLKYTQARVVV